MSLCSADCQPLDLRAAGPAFRNAQLAALVGSRSARRHLSGLLVLVGGGDAAMHVDGRFGFPHAFFTKIGAGLISLHIGTVAWHQFIRRDDILGWMLPAVRVEAHEREQRVREPVAGLRSIKPSRSL